MQVWVQVWDAAFRAAVTAKDQVGRIMNCKWLGNHLVRLFD